MTRDWITLALNWYRRKDNSEADNTGYAEPNGQN